MVHSKSGLPNVHHNNSTIGTILVTGEGVVAHRVALKLIEAGYTKVRVGVKDIELGILAINGKANVVKFDWDDETTYKNALKDIKTVFWSMPHHENWQHQYKTFLQEAKHVKHFVKLSFSHSLISQADTMHNFCTAIRKEDPFLKIPMVQMHREIDSKIIKMSHSINYTILFASHFMSNPTVHQADRIRTEHKFIGASGGRGVNYVSPNDVADVAVHALLEPKLHHRVGYNLTGPSPMKESDIAKELSELLHVPIKYEEQPLESFDTTGTDWGSALDVMYLEFAKASGIEETMKCSKDIQKVCGHPAETYHDYLSNLEYMTAQERKFFLGEQNQAPFDSTLKHVKHIKTSFPTVHANSSIGTILVTGEGVVAHRVALKLIAAGYFKVRVGVKDTELGKQAVNGKAEVVKFDWDDETTYKNALKDVKTVFWSMPHHENWQHQYKTFLQEAKHVKHFVKLSFSHSLISQADTMHNFVTAIRKDDPFLKIPMVQMHREIDSKIIKMPHSVNYTILFASHFMSNPTVYQAEMIRTKHKFVGASGGHGVNYVSPNDVADVAVHALLEPKLHHRVGYNLTGPAPIKESDIAEKLSERLHVLIKYEEQPLESFEAAETNWGSTLDVMYLEFAKASGVEENMKSSKDIEKVCGHPAESYNDYLSNLELMTAQERKFFLAEPNRELMV